MKLINDDRLQSWNAKFHEDLKYVTSQTFREEVRFLFARKKDKDKPIRRLIFLIGALLTAISFSGLLLGYVRGFNKFMRPKSMPPRLHNLPKIVKYSMAIGVLVVWSVIIGAMVLFFLLQEVEPDLGSASAVFIGFNLLTSFVVYIIFVKWRIGMQNLQLERDKFGTARFAGDDELEKHRGKPGLYIGGDYTFNDKGHCLLVMPTRSGKSQNILMANALYSHGYKGSLVYIDPKGEAAAVSADHLRKLGKNVVILNPWEILPNFINGNSNYNPLDLLVDKTSDHLIDDVSLIAELIIPTKTDDKNSFFTDSARNLIAGMLLHLVTSDKVEIPTLDILWEWVRYSGADWDNLLADMYDSQDPINGRAIKMTASEIARQMESPETFSSIMANVLMSTNFLKSHALQRSLQPGGFAPYSLSDGNTVVFVVIPFEKLKSHSNYLRLVVTTLMRAMVRKPSDNQVTFVCDEAFNLGYISEFETALSGYAGFNITLWLVYQDLTQIKDVMRWCQLL
jgi:type IV secretion system protein VirD4